MGDRSKLSSAGGALGPGRRPFRAPMSDGAAGGRTGKPLRTGSPMSLESTADALHRTSLRAETRIAAADGLSSKARWTGRVLSGLALAFLAMDAAMKLLRV